jgi:DNA-binding response OmpR family regulator
MLTANNAARQLLAPGIQGRQERIRMARILVADDEPHIRALVSLLLQRAGHTVIEAPDGATALEMIERERPDLAILDTRLPEPDGFQVYDALRANTAQNALPVIFLAVRFADSAPWQQHEGPNLARLGRPYLVKPFSPEALVDAVERELSRLA